MFRRGLDRVVVLTGKEQPLNVTSSAKVAEPPSLTLMAAPPTLPVGPA